jgi:hypothetical protein
MTVYSAIQFLMWLLIAASVIAVVAARVRVPYTAASVWEAWHSVCSICHLLTYASVIGRVG